ncbi:hypothetical protein [Clostridium sardiniense]|nr:hypothetical protein [Clostridium sardiniense]MDQ0461643.1 hypothetical protein [Clostridium sardiniense]
MIIFGIILIYIVTFSLLKVASISDEKAKNLVRKKVIEYELKV